MHEVKKANPLEELYETFMKQRLGDISGLPEELAACVAKTYHQFISSYLNILRQKEKKPADWIPETLSIDYELEDGMRHFFSDYQHITRQFNWINKKIDHLQQIDKDIEPRLYEFVVDNILKGCQSVIPGDEADETV